MGRMGIGFFGGFGACVRLGKQVWQPYHHRYTPSWGIWRFHRRPNVPNIVKVAPLRKIGISAWPNVVALFQRKQPLGVSGFLRHQYPPNGESICARRSDVGSVFFGYWYGSHRFLLRYVVSGGGGSEFATALYQVARLSKIGVERHRNGAPDGASPKAGWGL